MGEMKNTKKSLSEDLKGRPKYVLNNSNIKTDLKKLGLEGVNWIHLAQGRGEWRDLVNMIINLQVL
jgi:hypothetical protein